MTHQIECCRLVSDSPSIHGVGQMLDHMLVTDYFDGPIAGFLRCDACSSVHFFTTIAWSRNSFVRVIALATVPEDSWFKLISFFGEIPSGQCWIPPILSRPTEQELDRIEAFLKSITAQAGVTTLILAWDITSTKVLAARKVEGLSPPSDLNMFSNNRLATKSAGNWFANLGLAFHDL